MFWLGYIVELYLLLFTFGPNLTAKNTIFIDRCDTLGSLTPRSVANRPKSMPQYLNKY